MKNKAIIFSFFTFIVPVLTQANSQGWKCLDVDRRISNASLTVKTATDEIHKAQQSIQSIEKALARMGKDCSKLSGPQCNPALRQTLQSNLISSMQRRDQVAEIHGKTQAKLSELKILKKDCQGKKIEMVLDVPESLRQTIR